MVGGGVGLLNLFGEDAKSDCNPPELIKESFN